MSKTIFVTGHKNPDSDSICSAMAYANLKQQLGVSALAIRQGPLNEETKYILKRFDMENPFLLNDARSQLRDITIDEATLIPKDMTMAEAWKKLYTVKNKSLFVVDEEKHLAGIVSTSNLSSTRMMEDERLNSLIQKASVQQIADTIKGEIMIEPECHSTNGKIYIVTLINGEHFSDEFQDSIVILSDGDDKQRQLMDSGAKLLVITCGEKVSEENCAYAKEKGCAIICTDLDTMKVARVITEAVPVEYIMTRNLVTFLDTEYVNDVSQRISHSRFRSYPVINEYGNIVGAISRYHLSNYERRKFILVDHSAKNQSINNIDEGLIEEIIDHHHIGNIETSYPIYYRNMRCGCTSSIVALLYQENHIVPSREMAGLMLGAIISDTMHFKSKTTTEFDKQIAEWLAEIAQVDLIEYAEGVLSASVSLKESQPKDILKRDLKTYEIGKYRFAIGQTNFNHMEDLQKILPDFKEYLIHEQERRNYDLLIMMFSNINAEGSMFVYSGPLKNVMKEIIETEFDESSGFDSLIISRKQQLVPKLSELLKMM